MFTVDPASSVPPFEQLRSQVLEAVAGHVLAPGDRLPTVRALAEQLGVAPGTVARAYRELESAGVIETRGRSGSFVSAHGDPRTRRAQEAAASYAAEVRSLGFDPAAALELVRAALHA